MANPRKRSPDRQSWKQGIKQQQQTPLAFKWFATLLLVAFLGIFVWYWWPSPSIRVQFLALEVGDYRKLVAPQLPSDTSALDTDAEFLRFLDYREIAGLDAGRSDLLNIAKSENKDGLVVYLSAHLVPIGEEKVGILPRNYELSEESPVGTGHYELGDLLARMKENPARLKLLLIDSGRLTIDARLGLLGNRAYSLLQSELDRAQDSSLCILVSNGPFENATGWYGRSQSFFGEAVTDAFLGAADSDEDKWLTVGELFDYVATECFSKSGLKQSPALLIAQSGPKGSSLPDQTANFKNKKLFPFESRKSNATEPDVASEEEAEAEAQLGNQNKDKAADNDEDSAGATPQDVARLKDATRTQNEAPSDAVRPDFAPESPSGSATPSSPADTAAKTDSGSGDNSTGSSESNSNSGLPATGPKPTVHESTPHYLRTVDKAWRLNDQILESKSLATKAPHLARELAARILDYELRFHGTAPNNDNGLDEFVRHLEQVASRDATSVDGELGQRIAATLNAYDLSGDTETPAVREVQRIAYQTRDYLDWHARTVFLQDVRGFAGQLESLLRQINAFRDDLPSESIELTRATELQLNDSLQRIEATDRQVRNEWLNVVQNSADDLGLPVNQCLVEATLGTCLPSPSQRAQWRSDLFSSRQETLKSKQTPNTEFKTQVPSQLQTHIELETLRLGNDVPEIPIPTSWQNSLPFSTALASCFANLPSAIDSETAAAGAWRLANVDYRDSARIKTRSTGQFQATYSPRAVFAWSSKPTSAELGARGINLPWSLKNTTGKPADVRITFNSDDVMLFAGKDDSADRIKSNASLLVNGSATQNWFAVPTDPRRESSLQIPLKFTIRSGANRLPDTVITLTQVVNDIGIKVYNLTGNDLEQSQRHSVVQLKPYPNRPTRFRFELSNPSSQSKTVEVQIAVVPPSKVTPGLLTSRNSMVNESIVRNVIRNGKLAPGTKVVAESKAPITVPPNSSVPLVLGLPKPKSIEGDEPPQRAPKNAPVDVSYGLVCEITEQGTDEDKPPTRWMRWMEIRPARPSSYLTCVADYTPKAGTRFGEFTATIEPNAASIPDVSQRPILIDWDTSFLTMDPGGRRRGRIKAADNPVKIHGNVSPPATVWIDADSYPRAFSFQISEANGVEEGHKPMATFTSLRKEAFARSYVQKGLMDRKMPELSEGQQTPRPTFLRGDLVPFPKLDTPLLLRFLVDAESKDFGADDSDGRSRDSVRLEIAGQEVDTYYDDRQIITTMTSAEDDTIDLICSVSDFEVQMEDPGISAPEPLELSMVIDGRKATSDQIRLSVDTTKPKVNLSLRPSQIYPGKFFTAHVSASDAESDIYKVSIGYVNDRNDPLTRSKSPESGMTLRMKAPSEIGRQWVRAEILNGALIRGFATANLSVVPKPKPVETKPPPPPPPPKYSVKGIAMFGVSFKRGITVTLPGKPPVMTGDSGAFQFNDVSGGEHTITFAGKIRGKPYAAEYKLTLPEKGAGGTHGIQEAIKLTPAK